MTTTASPPADRLPITTGFEELVARANAAVTTLSVEEARRCLADDDVVFVDVRDEPELEREGKIPGAVHASRGMLEFHVDPDSPYYKDEFSPEKDFILYCAVGGRSALSTERLQEMGLESVAHLGGGFTGWKEVEGPIEPVEP